MQRRQFMTGAAALGAALVLPTAARAQQDMPAGPVKIVVGFPAGGGTDVLARLLGQKLGVMWNIPVIVENRAGAAGVIAAEQVARQPNDGNTLLMAHVNSHGIAPGLHPKLAYSVEQDFSPIALVGKTPTILIGGASQPAKTLPELVKLCRAQPGKIVFGSAGAGSAQHLALEIFKARAGIDVLHVPYKGSAPLMNDLLGGHVQYCFEGMTTATPLVQSGKVIALAQTLQQRSKSHPNVPTVAEQGYPGFEASIWFGMVGPGKMPDAMVQRMNRDIDQVLAMADVQEKLAQVGAEDGGGSVQRFADFMVQEQRKYAQTIKDAKIIVES
ncbi:MULTISPECIES: Bug family tripartite tricarboxylate transporter substrate binding protein [Achromobacter]|uniref:Tripartite tricarboxylate transporter substrate binding protein n=1 Tax=Achromobacter spanius TaxID=217203 RepID=A0ABY8GSX8_9BURK|nr:MULTISPECIES: tripartite tricarboxylate transporter substrate binding protein [Achromobacter]WAI83085.1 tripartite tricarboxylate transporter substrate binding protein [Achromobacter spanius]WEX93169.1 tripartite tricarboxylate transporter substrate binding protein [Achromobacter sp. SS2-2022]WFP07674.1 tripartite tricarboxylate transporter substrate binding protein [Achromobacter spanius]